MHYASVHVSIFKKNLCADVETLCVQYAFLFQNRDVGELKDLVISLKTLLSICLSFLLSL